MSLNSSSNFSLHPTPYNCITVRLSTSISTALSVTYFFLLLPIFISVLYVGYQRWRERCSVATTATTNHSDIFTFNMVVLEMISLLGSVFYIYGAYTDQILVVAVGMSAYTIISVGQTLFHLLTCVERYLAVVHPVTYLGLRQAGGVRIRNISIGCVWLISFGSLIVSLVHSNFLIIFSFVLVVFSCIVVSLCSVSVLCVLIRPGPGEVGGNRERVDQSKQRAFYTIMAIMGALLLRFLSILVSTVIYVLPSTVLSFSDKCVVSASLVWFFLPSSLVLPLLFLHRAGKLSACKQTTVSA